MHDRKDDVRDVGLEALGNKASQLRERCPRGQRRRCLAQAVQAWMDSNEKTAREGTPEPKKVKEHSQLQAKRAYPTAGKELELLVIKHSAIEKIVEIPDEEWEFFRAVQRQ